MGLLLRACLVLLLLTTDPASAQALNPPEGDSGNATLEWKTLAPLPDELGFAGAFAGESNGALIVAGGANFPGGPPWQGHAKIWHDRIFVLSEPDGQWQLAEERLPRPLGYGVAVTLAGGVVCVGGSDADRHYADAFILRWQDGAISATPLPPLPVALANMSGAALGQTLYVAGGIETPGSTRASNRVFSIDLSQVRLAWTELPPLPGPARMLALAAAQDNSFLLISGVGLAPDAAGKPVRTYLTDAYAYTQAIGWRRLADVPHAVAAAPSPAPAVGQSHVLVLGGDDGTKVNFEPREKHPGFSRAVLAYHTVTDTWTPLGTLPAAHVTTPIVPWRGGFVMPTGEVRPGVRSPIVHFATPVRHKSAFGWLNYATLGLYPLIMLGISWVVGKKQTSDEFFRGGQRIPWWAAGLSIYATMLSSITYMAVPAKSYATDWSYFMSVFAIVAIAPIVAHLYLPFFRQLDVTSAYEYLERRFNLAARWFGSASFVVLQLGRTAIVLYLPSLALATVTQIDVMACIVIMGVISILMTFLGGVEAVVWTDVAQTVILLAGAGLSLAFIIFRSDLTIGQMFDIASSEQKFFQNMSWGWDIFAATAPVIFIGTLLQNLIPYTASQDVVQRYLTTKDQRQARRAIMSNAWLSVPGSMLFFALGTALFVFYRTMPGRLDPTVTTDAIFPLFMVRELPAGLAGLVVAGIFAAAQPTSNLNSMATALVTDFYQRTKPGVSDADVLRWAQRLTVIGGIIGTGLALYLARLQTASLWDMFMKLIGLTGGALAGLFALGIFTTRANGRGALVGAAASVIVLYLVQQHTAISFFLYGGTGILTCFAVGYLASLVIPDPVKSLDGLTISTLRRRPLGLTPATDEAAPVAPVEGT